MQKAPLMIAIAAICAGGIGIGIAATSNRSAPRVAVSPSSQPSSSATPSPATSPVVTTSPPPPKPAPLDDFPHQRLVFRDEVNGSPFAPFRDRARAAIKRRDVAFMKSVVPKAGIGVGYGAPQTLQQWTLENPNAPFWSVLEKAIIGPCSLSNVRSESVPMVRSEQTADGFVCSNAGGEFEKQYPPSPGTQGVGHLIDKVIIEGEHVNVRAQPTTNSAIVARLSNEVVKLDQKSFETLYGEQQRYDPINSWMPIVLPNGKPGYVSSRYARQPLENQLIFAQINGKWQLTEIPGGD
ncbi:SH3 domain-containing protein [Myxacorys almedinensis]|uniref:SH3 domain-containing protein n=1 Tax=Myxacorys almedinensis A TaxID=2690445 RepID=A0A8J8CK82_9CYAN|nr:SH3 domain-containing protein [Myxacorys almedinensis]NDJ18336.1 hypothetical protein [Myxacorys almedinensis A]